MPCSPLSSPKRVDCAPPPHEFTGRRGPRSSNAGRLSAAQNTVDAGVGVFFRSPLFVGGQYARLLAARRGNIAFGDRISLLGRYRLLAEDPVGSDHRSRERTWIRKIGASARLE